MAAAQPVLMSAPVCSRGRSECTRRVVSARAPAALLRARCPRAVTSRAAAGRVQAVAAPAPVSVKPVRAVWLS
jgi:hypothetical protein